MLMKSMGAMPLPARPIAPKGRSYRVRSPTQKPAFRRAVLL